MTKMMEGRLEHRRSPFVVILFLLLCLCVLLNTTTAQQGSSSTAPTTQTKVLKVKVILEEPFIMRSKVNSSGYEGMFIDLLENITKRIDLTFTIDPESETVYGDELSPGNWTGLIGRLTREEADLVVAPLTIKSGRQKDVDFTLPIMTAGLRILFKPANPWTDTDSFTILWRPFTVGMWAVLLLMFVSVTILFYLLGRFSPYEDHAFVGKAATYEGLTLTNSFLYVFSSFTFQGYTAAPRSLSGRVLAAVWWVFVLLVISAYSASLCSIFLAFKPSVTSLPFATFDELSRQGHVAYGIYEGGVTEDYLKNSKRPLQRRLWGTINAHRKAVMVRTFADGVHRMRATPGQYALIMEGPLAEYRSEQAPCDLVTVGEELNQHYWGFACQKGSGVCSKFNTALLQLKEEDFISDLKKKWLHHGCQRDHTAEYMYQGVSYIDTFGGRPKYYADRSVTLRRFALGFFAIVVGMTLSASLLLGEILFAKRRGSPRVPVGSSDQERMDREYRDDQY